MNPALLFVTAGDPERLTGGNLYNRHVLDSLASRGIRVTRLALPTRRSRTSASLLQAAMDQFTPSMVLVDSIALTGAAPLAALIGGSQGARLVLLMHMLPSELASGHRAGELRQVEGALLGAADLVIAVSSPLRDRLVLAGASPDRVEVVEPGRDGVEPAGSADLRRRGPFRFLCVANWSPSKGIEDAVRAIAGVEGEAVLDLVGEEGGGAYPRRVHDLIDRLVPPDRVRVHGVLRSADLAQCYAQARAFLLPTRSEGFGTVFAEALSFGLPVLGYRAPSLSWLEDAREGEAACALLVPEGDVPALAGAASRLVSNPDLWHAMSRAALARASRLPTWAQTEQRFANLILALP